MSQASKGRCEQEDALGVTTSAGDPVASSQFRMIVDL